MSLATNAFRIFIALLLLSCLSLTHAEDGHAKEGLAQSLAQNLKLQPSPNLTPQEVVNFQLTALQHFDKGGIAATFRFASPANQRITGPLAKFSRLFDSTQYQPMLNHRGTDIKLVSDDGLQAEILAGVVDQSGDMHWYQFRLSRQQSSPFKDCWMTDSVMAVAHSGRSA